MNRLPLLPRAVLTRVLTALLVTGLAVGCAPDRSDSPTAPQAEAQRSPLGLSAQELGPALAAQARHGERLMGIQGVVGHGVGVNEAGEPVVRVFTVQPGVRGIPDRLDGVGVDVQVTGMFWAGTTTDKHRPAPNGVSVGHPDITAGTLGARVTDGTDVYILSNNHVLANSNEASIGDPTLQPGAFDGGSNPADSIGALADFEPIDFEGQDNEMDAAVSIVPDAADLSGITLPEGYGAPGTEVVGASVGLDVQKFGRTTELTEGEVAEVNVTVDVCYAGFIFCTKLARFVNQISITPGSFSDGGDSGSLIVTLDAVANPVALLFAGSSTRTLGNPIKPVLDRFGVAIDPGDDEGGTTEPTNEPPNATFTFSCTDLSCDFDASGSSDSDGSITSYDWEFGDGNTGSGVSPTHTYGAGGTYTVTLTVTDDDDATGTDSQDVTVSDGSDPADDISLSAEGYKVRGVNHADLTWSGATSTNVDVYRDGSVITTTANDGAYTDNIGSRGGGSHTYRVCEAGTSTCSNEATVTF